MPAAIQAKALAAQAAIRPAGQRPGRRVSISPALWAGLLHGQGHRPRLLRSRAGRVAAGRSFRSRQRLILRHCFQDAAALPSPDPAPETTQPAGSASGWRACRNPVVASIPPAGRDPWRSKRLGFCQPRPPLPLPFLQQLARESLASSTGWLWGLIRCLRRGIDRHQKRSFAWALLRSCSDPR